jgi:hypothetical protein
MVHPHEACGQVHGAGTPCPKVEPNTKDGGVAQLVQHPIPNRTSEGSIPSAPAIIEAKTVAVVPQIDPELKPYVDKGLTETEARTLKAWVDEGKPGLMKQRAESYGQIYALGYSCEEIHKWFPIMPIPLLLWARITYAWDDTRDRYRRIMQGRALEAALGARNESIRLMADTLAATNQAWRQKLMDYLADPKKEKAPDFLPTSLAAYQKMLDMMEGLAFPKEVNKSPPPGNGPLVNINLGTPQGVEPKDVASSLIAEMQGKKA